MADPVEEIENLSILLIILAVVGVIVFGAYQLKGIFGVGTSFWDWWNHLKKLIFKDDENENPDVPHGPSYNPTNYTPAPEGDSAWDKVSGPAGSYTEIPSYDALTDPKPPPPGSAAAIEKFIWDNS